MKFKLVPLPLIILPFLTLACARENFPAVQEKKLENQSVTAEVERCVDTHVSVREDGSSQKTITTSMIRRMKMVLPDGTLKSNFQEDYQMEVHLFDANGVESSNDEFPPLEPVRRWGTSLAKITKLKNGDTKKTYKTTSWTHEEDLSLAPETKTTESEVVSRTDKGITKNISLKINGQDKEVRDVEMTETIYCKIKTKHWVLKTPYTMTWQNGSVSTIQVEDSVCTITLEE